MLTIAIFLLGIPSIGFAQSDESLPNDGAKQQPNPRHLSIPIEAPCRKRLLPVAVTKVLVETTMAPLTTVAEVMKTVEMAAMSRIGAF